jgi:hypothetical protein
MEKVKKGAPWDQWLSSGPPIEPGTLQTTTLDLVEVQMDLEIERYFHLLKGPSL